MRYLIFKTVIGQFTIKILREKMRELEWTDMNQIPPDEIILLIINQFELDSDAYELFSKQEYFLTFFDEESVKEINT